MKTSRKLLICAACASELRGSRALYPSISECRPGSIFQTANGVDVLIYGVGMFQAGYHTAKALADGEYGLVLAAGIAGAYDSGTELGSAMMASSVAFADCATENPDGSMRPVVGSQFLPANGKPFADGAIPTPVSVEIAESLAISCAKINTVNHICTRKDHLDELLRIFPADIETMESAAVAYTCAMEGVRYAELRGISNHTVPKNEGKWMIAKAIERIGTILDSIISDNCKLLRKYLD